MNGKIEAVSTKEYKGKTYYSMKVNDTWYGAGLKSPGVKGDFVEFDAEQNDKGYWNAGNIKKVAGASVQNPSSGGASSAPAQTDWAAKDRSISWQAARNSANALLAVGASVGYQDFPDTFVKLQAKSDELTLKFFNSSQNPGGTTEAAKASKPSPRKEPEPEEEDPFHDDTIPF